ncbi:MAG TPA: LamG-like jellyroll fold domain-containing protein [Mycobacterium sp.]|nr:LamG-like jellyroll fold domain-containing protein [Mycobacterium sp.]
MAGRTRVRTWMSWLLVPVAVTASLAVLPSPTAASPAGHLPVQKPVPAPPGSRPSTPRQPVGRIDRSHVAAAGSDQAPHSGGAGHLPALLPGAVGPQIIHPNPPNPSTSTSTSQTLTPMTPVGAPATGFVPGVSVENTAARTASTTVFDNPDGTHTMRVYDGIQFVRNASGAFVPVDSTLVRNVMGRWVARAAAPASIAPSSTSTQVATMSLGTGEAVAFGIDGAAAVTPVVSGDTVSFPDVRPDSTDDLTIDADQVKENLVLSSADAPTSWLFPLTLTGLTARMNAAGEVEFVDAAGTVQAVVPVGYMEDANVNPHSGAGAQSSGVTFSLVPYGSGQAIRMDLDSAWLHDSARVFPVTVDPTVNAMVDSDDTYVSSHDDANTDNSGKHDLAVGTYNGGTEKAAGYMHLSALTGSGSLANKFILGATLNLFNYWSYSCNPRSVSIYRVTQSWSGSTTKTYPGPSYDSAHSLGSISAAYGYTSCPTGGWISYTLSPDEVTKWTHGLESFYGITVRASLTDSYAWKRFASAQFEVSADHPYMSVNYSDQGASYVAPQQFNPPVTAGSAGNMTITVTNLGSSSWTTSNGYKLTYAILNSSGSVIRNGPSYAMPKTVAPGQSVNVPISVAALAIGSYTLRVDMLNPSGQSFHTTYGSSYGTRAFTSSNGVPQVVGYYPINNGYVSSVTPTLWAHYYDPDNTSTTHQFQFKVCNGTPAAPTNCQLSGTITSATWTPPTALTWNTQWFWYVSVSDTVTWSGQYGPFYFTPVAAQPEVTSHLAGAPDSADVLGLNPQVGNYTTSVTDAHVAVAGPALQIIRSYNSQDLRTGEAFGAGWSSALDQSVVADGDGSGSVVVTLASGMQLRFSHNADGSYSPPQGTQLTLVATTSPAGWTLRDSSGFQRLFNTAGQLTTVIDASGNSQTYTYTSGQVTTVTDAASGRPLHITWSGPGGHVTGVAEDAPGVGQTAPSWTYTYTGNQLTQVCSPLSVSACISYGYTASTYYQSVIRDDNPTAYWPLDETSGSAAVNAASTDDGAFDGDDQDVTLGQPGAISGSSGTAIGFTGTSDSFIALPDDLASSSMAFAVELWFKAAAGAHGVLMGEQNQDVPTTPTHLTPMLYIGTDGKLRGQEWNGAPTPITTASSVTDGNWHHAVLSVNVNTQTLYLDGTVIGTLSGTITHQDMDSYMLGIGTTSSGWPSTTASTALFPFTGSIDEAAFYAHPLSQAQVLAHYNVRTAGSRLTTVTEPGAFTASTVAYDPATGRVTTLTDRNGETWNLAAPTNTAGTRTVVLSSSDTSPISYDYDTTHFGRLADRTDGLGTTSYQYNASGFVSQVTDANGNITSYQTNARGNRIATTTCRTTPTCQTSYASYYLNTTNPLDPRNDVMVWSADARSSSSTDTTYRTTFTIDTNGRVTGTSYPVPAGQSTHPTAAASYSTVGVQPGGLVLTTTARNGGVTHNTYSNAGDLLTTIDPAGLTTTFTYDNLGRVLTADRSAVVGGNTVDYGTTTSTYNGIGEFATQTMPPVTNTITSVTHIQVVTYTYDAMGRCTSQVVSDSTGGDASRTTTWAYDPAGRLISTTDPATNSTTQTWDAAGDMDTRTQPNGLVLSYTYNDHHQLEETDATGTGADPMNPTATTMIIESRAYDPGGRLASVTDAMGRETDYTYFGDNLEATTTVVTRDAGGNITASTQTSSDAYDNAGHLTSHTAQGGIVTTTSFDPAGYRTGQTFDPSGLNRHVAYANNLDGSLASQTLTAPVSPGRSEVTSFTYDADGRQLTQTVSNTGGSPANLTTTVVRDPRGLVTQQTDPAGIVTSYTYDVRDQLATQVGAARTIWVNGVQTTGVTPTTTVGLDTFGDVADQRDPAGAVIHMTFDADGRNTAITLPSYTPPNTGVPVVATSHTAYDAVGNVASTTDALGRVTSTTYDPYGDVLTVTAPDPDGSGPKTAPVITNSYDRDWELLSSTDPTGGQTQATYNYLGQRVSSSVSDRDTGTTIFFTTSYGYNAAGDQTTVTDPLTNVTTTDYDTAGEPTKVTDPTSRFTQVTYDLAGRPTSQVRGKGSSYAKTIYTYGYDLAGRRTTEVDCTVTSTGTCATAQRTITASYNGDGNTLQTTTGACQSPRIVEDSVKRPGPPEPELLIVRSR